MGYHIRLEGIIDADMENYLLPEEALPEKHGNCGGLRSS